MEGELWGLGRTWWVAILIIAGAFIMLALNRFDAQMCLDLIKWIFGFAAGKSAIVGGAKNITINPKKEGEQ
jgi:hypothetical protein